MNASQKTLSQIIGDVLEQHEMPHYGVTPLTRPLSMDIYNRWIAEGLHGDMQYLARHQPAKENPQLLQPQAKTAICIAQSYLPHPVSSDFPMSEKTAFYALGEDYHDWFYEKILSVCKSLENIFKNNKFLCYTDSGPILERDLHARAGLGWIGKNTCLIDESRGSFFLLGEILTDLEVTASTSIPADRCGTCTRCIDICPTNALREPRVLDATRCISYHTIESKSVAPPELRRSFEGLFFGCDLCQTVCPWNQKAHKSKDLKESFQPKSRSLIEDLKWVLSAPDQEIKETYAGLALSRAKPWMLRRNALVVIANLKLQELENLIQALPFDTRLDELRTWCLEQLR